MSVNRAAQKSALAAFCLTLLYLFSAAGALAAPRFEAGLLWKIERPGLAPSYLFGTMHSEDPQVLALPPVVQQTFDAANGLTLEVVLDMQNMLAMAAATVLADGSTLESHVGPALYKRCVAALADHGLPQEYIATMKPWAAAVTLMQPPGGNGVVLDLMLYQEALAAGKPVEGLETAAEQLALFDDLSEADQVAMLRDTLDNLPEVKRLMVELKAAYLARDLQRLVEISDASMAAGSDPALAEKFTRTVIVERNHRMASRMQPQLKSGNRFIAVGALHLPGEEGLLNLLSRQGYTLSRVY